MATPSPYLQAQRHRAARARARPCRTASGTGATVPPRCQARSVLAEDESVGRRSRCGGDSRLAATARVATQDRHQRESFRRRLRPSPRRDEAGLICRIPMARRSRRTPRPRPQDRPRQARQARHRPSCTACKGPQPRRAQAWPRAQYLQPVIPVAPRLRTH